MEDEQQQRNNRYTFDKEFHEIVSNVDVLRRTTEKFLNNLIDDITLGIIFDMHRKFKMNTFNLDMDDMSPNMNLDIETRTDIFNQSHVKKTMECMCPKCGKCVLATGFAHHLASCMGIRRSRSRNSSKRIVNINNREKDNQSQYSGLGSDDEDEVYWNSVDKRRKKKYRNGNRKGKGTPKKSEPDVVESINVDIEGEDESDITNLRDLLQFDNSNGSSPADSVNMSGSLSTKKKDKSKSKKKQ